MLENFSYSDVTVRKQAIIDFLFWLEFVSDDLVVARLEQEENSEYGFDFVARPLHDSSEEILDRYIAYLTDAS